MSMIGAFARVLLAAGLVLGTGNVALAGKRALIIGNDAYDHLQPLQKAVGDAQAMKAALERLGFSVTYATNLDYRRFVATLSGFTAEIVGGDEVVVHYSGHGVAIGGRNYLLPIDMEELGPGQETSVDRLTFDASEIVEDIRRKAPRFVFAVLDACRNNPFQGPVRSVGMDRGLARMEAEAGTYILFSAGPGQAALDRIGNDDRAETSVFTRTLLKHIETPGLTLYRIAKATQAEVHALARTINHPQLPSYSENGLEEPILKPAPASPVARAPKQDRHDDAVIADAKVANGVETHEAYRKEQLDGQPDAEVVARIAALLTPPTQPEADVDFAAFRELRLLQGHADTVTSVTFSPDGRLVASGSSDNTIKLWEAASGKIDRSLQAHKSFLGADGLVDCVAFSPDGRLLASGSWDKTIRLWDVASGKPVRSLRGHPGEVSSVMFSPDGRQLVSGSHDKSVRLWNVASGRLVRALKGHADGVRSVVFSPDGQMLASGGWDKTVRLWDTASGKLIRSLDAHAEAVQSVAFSPDGRLLASASEDKTIKFWDAASGALVRSLEGHADTVSSIAFSPDGRRLASGSYDKTVKLWDVASGKFIRSVEGHTSWVLSVAFSPDGRMVASGSGDVLAPDDTIRIWGDPAQVTTDLQNR